MTFRRIPQKRSLWSGISAPEAERNTTPNVAYLVMVALKEFSVKV
jgi:hypothetical protein